jgi:Trehalose utilisation.
MALKARIAIGALVALCLALTVTVFVVATTANEAQSKNSGAPHHYADELRDYGVCMGLDEKCYNGNWTPPFKRNEVPRVLVFSRTAGPRHAHLGPELDSGLNPPLGPGNVAQQAIVDWGAEYGFQVDWTEDLSWFGNASRLRNYNTIVFLSNTRDFLDDAAQTALMQYIRSGGGFVAIHNPLGAEYNWDYFQGLLGGANFYDHGPRRPGVVVTESRKDVSTKDLPQRWNFADEWYNLEPMPSPLVRILAKVDTKTLNPVGGSVHPGHAGNHPVSWCHYFDGGRAWVTSLGHDNGAWQGTTEGSQYFKQHVLGGILSTAGVKPFCK